MAAEKVSQTRTASLLSFLRLSPRLAVALSAAHHRRVAVWNRFLSSCSFCGVLETKEFVTNLPPPLSDPSFVPSPSLSLSLSLSFRAGQMLARIVIPNAR